MALVQKFLVFLLLPFNTLMITAQGMVHQRHVTVSGIVFDQQRNPVPFAHVQLIMLPTDRLIASASADAEGKFKLQVNPVDSIGVRITSVGYKDFQSKILVLKQRELYELDPITLVKAKVELEEVQISERLPKITQKSDRTIVNLQDNVLASGASALEILSRLPGVFVDKDGNITLNNKNGILVTVNGRPTYMEPQDLATYLKAMPSENLKNIELFSNPPANYDAMGAGGVINLNLKKGTDDGFDGTISAGSRYNGGWSYTSAASLNYRHRKWQSHIGISRNNYFHTEDMEIDKIFRETGVSSSTLFFQHIDWDVRTKTTLLDAVLDYSIGDEHKIGVSYQLANEHRKDYRHAVTDMTESGESMPLALTQIDDTTSDKRHSLDLFYIRPLDTLGSNISADLVYIRSEKGFRSLLTVPDEDGAIEINEGTLKTRNPVTYDVYSAQVDFTKSTIGTKTFKAGLKYSTVRSDNDLKLDSWMDERWTLDEVNSNRFLYEEKVAAAYISSYTPIGEKFKLNLGLRLEHTDMLGRSKTTGERNERSYLNLFPSFSLEQGVSKAYRIAYNYNRRITRPNYKFLNPFKRYLNAYTIQTGNPQLKPMYSNNYEINNIIHDKYQVAISYSRTVDIFGAFPEQNDLSRVTSVHVRNFDSQKNIGIRLNAPMSFAKWWLSENVFNVNRTSYNFVIDSMRNRDHQWSYSLQTQHSFDLPADMKLQISGTFFGPRLFGIYTLDPLYWIDAGVQKSFFKKKLTANINFNDIFATQVYSNPTHFRNIDAFESAYYATRMVLVNFKYTFSKGKSVSQSKRSIDQEETNRMTQ